MSNMKHEVRQADLSPGAGARPVGRVAIVGANAAGVGIAMDLLDAGIPVTLFELESAALDKGRALAGAAYGNAVAQGELAAAARDRRMALLAGTVYLHHLKDADLIIDMACTDMAGKEKLFRRLDQVAKRGAILATRSAHAGVDRLAACTRRAGEVLALHVANPGANPAQSWELVPGKETSGATLDTVIALARQLRKPAAVSAAGHRAAAQLEGLGGAWQVDQAQE
jgi:3-hydroxyacyl-CoA dehydrogenase